MKRTFFYIFLFAISITFFSCKKKRDISKISYLDKIRNHKDSLVLVFTGNLEGYIEPCGCTSNPLGGIARFSQVFLDLKSILGDNIYLIDTGNLLFENLIENKDLDCQNEAKINILLKTLKSFGLDQTTPGPFDKVKGENYYQELYKKYQIKIDNIKIIENKKFNIAILSINNENKKDFILSQIKNFKSNIKPHLIILVSQLLPEKTNELFAKVKDIDVILQGQSQSFVPKNPQSLSSGGFLFEGGRQGQYFTALFIQNMEKIGLEKIILDDRDFQRESRTELLKSRLSGLKEQIALSQNEKRAFLQKRIDIANQEIIALEKELINEKPLKSPNIMFYALPLDRKIDEDPQVKKDVEGYEKSILDLVKKCEENIICPKALPNEAFFVGANVCKGCHLESFNFWEKSIISQDAIDMDGKKITRRVGHSKAWKTLTDIKKEHDRTCIGCHSIGFMQKGGYCKTAEADKFANVQCEACHGAGSLHVKTLKREFITRNMKEDGCRACHHMPHIEKYESFDYEERLKKILGPGHGEKLLKELSHKKKPDA